MQVTKNNIHEIIFENQDAKLLIEDVVSHTTANLYFYHDIEVTVKAALQIWNQAMRAEECNLPYHVSILDLSKTEVADALCF